MLKEPSFSVRLSQLDRMLLESSPFYRIDLLRVVMSFRSLGGDDLKTLEEYADAADGKIERWLLVPSSMTLAVLAFTIDRAFGLIPTGRAGVPHLPG